MKPNHKNVEGYGGQNNELLLEQRWLPSTSKDLIAFARNASITSSESATATITCGSALSSELMR